MTSSASIAESTARTSSEQQINKEASKSKSNKDNNNNIMNKSELYTVREEDGASSSSFYLNKDKEKSHRKFTLDDAKSITDTKTVDSSMPPDMDDLNLDNLSFSSDDTVDLISEARNYYLEDDDEVENRRLFLSESRYHSTPHLSLSNAVLSRSTNRYVEPVEEDNEEG